MAPRKDSKQAAKSTTAADVVAALKARHPDGQWAFLAELRVGTGYGKGREYDRSTRAWKKIPNEGEQRLDAWAMNCWPSKGFHCVAYEVKVSRADFLHELKHPAKRELGLRYSNQFYFATPKGLVKPAELPAECGLVEVERGLATVVVEAPAREMAAPPLRFVAALARRAGRSLKTPGEVKAIEEGLALSQSRAYDGLSQTWALEGELLELKRLVGALLDLDGWLYEERRGWTLPDGVSRGGLSEGEALRVELARLKRELPPWGLRLPNPHYLDDRYANLLQERRSTRPLFLELRELAYRSGGSDPATLGAALVKRTLLWGRDTFKEPAWAAAVLLDALLQENDYRLARAEPVVRAFLAIRDDAASALDWGRVGDPAVADLRRAVVPGQATKELGQRLPGLKAALLEALKR